MNPNNLKTSEPFISLFPIDAKTQGSIYDHMKDHGYDPAHPVIRWKERGVVLDGHTRLAVALILNIQEVPVIDKSFATEDEAVEYAIHCQRDRRNITDADLVRWIGEMDKRKKAGRPSEEKLAPSGANKKSSEEIAEKIGVSARKVERVRTVLDHAPKPIKQAVLAGEKSINKAYTETQAARRPVGTDKGPAAESDAEGSNAYRSRFDINAHMLKGVEWIRKWIDDAPKHHKEKLKKKLAEWSKSLY